VQVLSAPSRFSMQKMLDFVCGKWRVSVTTFHRYYPLAHQFYTISLNSQQVDWRLRRSTNHGHIYIKNMTGAVLVWWWRQFISSPWLGRYDWDGPPQQPRPKDPEIVRLLRPKKYLVGSIATKCLPNVNECKLINLTTCLSTTAHCAPRVLVDISLSGWIQDAQVANPKAFCYPCFVSLMALPVFHNLKCVPEFIGPSQKTTIAAPSSINFHRTFPFGLHSQPGRCYHWAYPLHIIWSIYPTVQWDFIIVWGIFPILIVKML